MISCDERDLEAFLFQCKIAKRHYQSPHYLKVKAKILMFSHFPQVRNPMLSSYFNWELSFLATNYGKNYNSPQFWINQNSKEVMDFWVKRMASHQGESCTLIFSCNRLASNCSPSVKMSKEAIDAMASSPMYSSKSSLPKSIAKIAAGSIMASLQQKDNNAHQNFKTQPVITKKKQKKYEENRKSETKLRKI